MEKPLFHQMSVEEALDAWQSNANLGLKQDEAARRLKKYGLNQIRQTKQVSPLQIFISQFRDFMVLVLMVATAISYYLGEVVDAVTIMVIVVLNATLGFFQEFRAERSLASLKSLAAPTARVLRSGRLVTLPATELVPGDVLMLEAGDRIPADARLVEAINLDVEESALTGESLPVAKTCASCQGEDLPLGDRHSMVFQGTTVTRGRGSAVVCATGMQTEMGRIAGLMEESTEQETPLQHKLDNLGKVLIAACALISVLVIVGGIWRGQEMYHMFMTGVSLAVAAIPEGLPAIVTIVLALGVQRMIRANAIVRRLPAVETLGCATVICSDKTGTLTQNEMTVRAIYSGGRSYTVDGDGYTSEGRFYRNGRPVDPALQPDLKSTLLGGMICNNARINQEGKHWQVQGDPTEAALLVAGVKAGLGQSGDGRQLEGRRLGEVPFESERKRMSVLWQKNDGLYAFVKGAPDPLLSRCGFWLVDGMERRLTPEDKERVLEKNEELARQALRVLAIAFKRIPSGQFPGKTPGEDRNSGGAPDAAFAAVLQERLDAEQIESDLVFAGLVGMMDPPRTEVLHSMELCKQAGLRAIMITGDHKLTAEAVAREIGMLPPRGRVVGGTEIDRMDDEQLARAMDQIYVFARVSPLHKLRIVRVLKSMGQVVAMTGDGVNDAPAVKEADIGVAMGGKGTDVTKEASDIVLTDDNFATIVSAIREGRAIFDNIRKFIRYLLACNTGEVMIMLLATALALPLPLLPIQILLINLVTDGLPAIALGVDPAAKDVMQRRPRNPKESIFSGGLWLRILERGCMIGLVSLAAFVAGALLSGSLDHGRSMATATLVLSQLLHVFDCRVEKGSLFQVGLFANRALIAAVFSSLCILLAVIYVPVLQGPFGMTVFGADDWLIVALLAGSSSLMARVLHMIGGSLAWLKAVYR